MLGIKSKIIKFIDSRIEIFMKSRQDTKKRTEEDKVGMANIDMSVAEAQQKKEKSALQNNLNFSFQRGIESLVYNKDGKQCAMDSIDSCVKNNKMTGLSGSPKDIVFSFFAKFGFIGWQICSVLAQHWLISKACNIANKDCLRNGWINVFVDKKDTEESEEEKEKNQELLNKLYDIEQQEYKVNDKLLKWGFLINAFGVAYLLPKIDGVEYDKPFNIDGIKKGSFKGISVIEPYWVIPEFDKEDMTNPTSIHFFEPEYYRTNDGQRIHRSHIIVGRRKFVSDILKPSYYFGGISLAQEMYERVYASERSANEAPLLLLTKRLNVYKTKLKEVFANPQHYKDLMSVITDMRDNQGILFADLQDEISQIDTTLSDLDEVIFKQYQLCSAIAEVPVDKLFETNPTGGLSASGDYNIKNYNQNLNTLQTDRFKPAIDRINEIVMKSYFDKKDRIGIVFNSTDNPTEKDIADLNKQKADTDISYIQNGIITPEEARQRLVNDKTSGYAFLKGVEKEEPTEEEQQEIENMMKGMEENNKGQDADDVEVEEWITVNGVHIPIKKGQNKEDVIKGFIEKVEKENKKDYNISGENKQTTQKQKEQTSKSIGKTKDFNDKTGTEIVSFSDKQDDKTLNIDKVIESIQDYDFTDEKSGKKYHFSKEDIKKKIQETEEKISKIKENTTDANAIRNEDGTIKEWKKERAEFHNKKLEELFKGAKPSAHPEIVVLGGRGGSGKSKYANKEGYLVLDNDKIKEMIPEYKGWNAGEVHEEAGHILKQALNIARQNNISVVLDGTLSGGYEKLKNKVLPFIENGYTLQAHYVSLPRQKSIQRAINRFVSGNAKNGKGRYVPISMLLKMTDNEKNFVKLLKDFNARRWSFSSSDVKKGEPIKYMYGNIEEGGKVWQK